MDYSIIDFSKIRDLSDSVMENGKPRILPAAFYASTTKEERALIGAKCALYGLPTTELIEWLTVEIGGRRAIEIGAAHGALCNALGIVGTDNFMQERAEIKKHYDLLGQKVISYGDNVQRMDAARALKIHSPQVVVASWVTHLYRPDHHEHGGNEFGVNEEALIDSCETYIFIGNESVHRGKSIWNRPHKKLFPEWLYSRSVNGSRDFIAVWGNPRRKVIHL